MSESFAGYEEGEIYFHCFGHVHEGSGIEVVDWTALEKKEAKEKSGGVERKNDPVHKDIEVEWTEVGCTEMKWRGRLILLIRILSWMD